VSTVLTTQPDAKADAAMVVHDDSAIGYMMDTAKFAHCYRIAKAMASGSLLPDHLRLDRDKRLLPPAVVAGNCFRIVNQAVRWNMDPFALVDETYVVANKLGYQGKLVAAVVNARAGLNRRLMYGFSGQGDGRTVTVIGQFEGEAEPRTITLSVAQAKTANQMWKTDPDQKLVYSGVTKWARRHCPEIMLGVLTDDDIERIERAGSRAGIGSASLDQLADKLLTSEGVEDDDRKQQAESSPPAAEPAAPPSSPAPPESQTASNPQPAAPPTVSQEDVDGALIEYQDRLVEAKTVVAVNEIQLDADKDSRLKGQHGQPLTLVRQACEARRKAIRSSRGPRSNAGGALFPTAPSAQEES
jgi:hypothetical protein